MGAGWNCMHQKGLCMDYGAMGLGIGWAWVSSEAWIMSSMINERHGL